MKDIMDCEINSELTLDDNNHDDLEIRFAADYGGKSGPLVTLFISYKGNDVILTEDPETGQSEDMETAFSISMNQVNILISYLKCIRKSMK